MTYVSNANKNTDDNQLLSSWFIVIFILSVLCIAYFLFPANTLRQQLLNATTAQPVVVFYLTQLIETSPDDYSLRIALAEQQIGLYQWEGAKEQIAWLEQHPELQNESRLLIFQLNYTQAYQMPLGINRTNAFNALRTEIASFVTTPFTQKQLNDLATEALGLNAPAIALKFYLRLENVEDPDLLRKIAEVALFASEYSISAQYSMRAMQNEKSVDRQRDDVLLALKALLAGSLYKEGLTIIATLPDKIIATKPMLIFLTKYTLAAGRPDLAQMYIKRTLLMKEIQHHE